MKDYTNTSLRRFYSINDHGEINDHMKKFLPGLSEAQANKIFLPMLILCLFICVNITIVLVLSLCLLHRVNQA